MDKEIFWTESENGDWEMVVDGSATVYRVRPSAIVRGRRRWGVLRDGVEVETWAPLAFAKEAAFNRWVKDQANV